MGKIKFNNEREFEEWKIAQLELNIFKNKVSQLASMDYPKNYPCILCYRWMPYATDNAYNGFLNYDYIYSTDFNK
jgi:hypothetical protein